MKMKKIVLWSALGLCLSFTPAAAQYSLYWDLPASPAGLSLGLSSLILVPEPEGTIINPASLSSVKWRSAKAAGLQWWQDVYAGAFSAAIPFGRFGTAGASLGYWSFGTMAGLGPNGENLGNFESQALLWSAGYGRPLFLGWSAGFVVKGYSLLMLERKDWSWGGDFSLKYDYKFISAHILARNLGPKYPVNNAVKFNLPASANLGLATKFWQDRLAAALMYSSVRGLPPYLSAGVELKPLSFIALRFGYDNDDNKPERSRFGLGLSLNTTGAQDYAVEYGYRSYGALGNVHAVSLGLSF